MLSEYLIDLFKRDIEKVKHEISSYSNEDKMWEVAPGTHNSGGNLAMHLAGNLQHFFGAVLKQSGYKRDRDAEFFGEISREALIADLDLAFEAVEEALSGMSDIEMEELFPQPFQEKKVTNGWFISHLYGHLNYHLGQLNYHRRIIDVGN